VEANVLQPRSGGEEWSELEGRPSHGAVTPLQIFQRLEHETAPFPWVIVENTVHRDMKRLELVEAPDEEWKADAVVADRFAAGAAGRWSEGVAAW